MRGNRLVRRAAGLVALILALVPAHAAENFRLGVSAGTGLPISEFGTYFNSGLTSRAYFAYQLNPGVFVTAGSGFSRWTVDNQAVSDAIIPLIGLPIELSLDGSIRSIPFLIGIRYSPLPKGIQPFLELRAGVHFLTLELSGSVTTGPNVNPLPARSESWSAFGLAAGLGVALPVARRWAVEISATYSSVERAEIQILQPNDPTGFDVSAHALRSYEFQAGVAYAF